MLNRILTRWPLIIVGGALIIAFYRLFLGEVFFWGLPSLQFYPWREFALDTLRGGQLPLWNPFNGAGAPLLANYQSQLVYPFSWLGLLLPLGFVMSITAVLHLFMAAAGMWAFSGRIGLPTLGRGVSALAFGMTSYLVGRLGTYPVIMAAAWLPWILWATLGVLESRRPRDIGWLGLFTALQLLAGHAQTAWYSMLLVGLFTLYWIIRERPADWWKRLGLVVAGLILGAGIAAIQLLPTAELLRTSQRSGGVDFDFAMNFSYGPVRALNFLSPNVFGTPGDGSYITEGAFFEDAVYIGLLPLIAALSAMIGWIVRRFRKDLDTPNYYQHVPFWTAIVLLGLVFALGKNTGIYPFLFENVPTFSLFQAPVRWHLWTVFALSLLAGIGVSAAWGRGYWLFFGTRLAIAGCIGAVILALLVMPRIIPVATLENEGVQVLIGAVVLTGILGAIAGALTLLQPDRESARYSAWSIAVLCFVALDLVWAAQGLNPTVPSEFYNPLATSESGDSRNYWPEGVDAEGENKAEASVKFDTYLLFKDYRVATNQWQAYRQTNLPNMNLLDRRTLFNNFEPLRVGAFDAYIDLIQADGTEQANLLQAAAVSGVYDLDGELKPLDREAARAWFVDAACWHSDENDLVATMQDVDWQPLQQVHLSGAGQCETPTDENSPGTVTGIDDRINSLTVNVETESGGWLVLADTDYPGWVATIDGQSAEIQRANLMFRAVEIPAGVSEVRFDYRPGWLLPGLAISLISLLILVLLLRLQNPNTTEI